MPLFEVFIVELHVSSASCLSPCLSPIPTLRPLPLPLPRPITPSAGTSLDVSFNISPWSHSLRLDNSLRSTTSTYLGTINTLSTSAIRPLKITTLNHESRDNSMEMSSFVSESFWQVFVGIGFLGLAYIARPEGG